MASLKKILLVDDEKDILETLEKFFLYKGYQVSVASDGDEAIEKLSDEPALAILDLKMPKVNGVEVLKEIKKNHPNTETIILSGFADDFMAEINRIGADIVLTKPFSIERLLKAVEAALDLKPSTEGKDISSLMLDNHLVAKARIIIFAASGLIYANIMTHLNRLHYSGGEYEAAPAYNEAEFLEKIESFKPDIVLVDSVNFSQYKELAKKIYSRSHKPKDLIIFGAGGEDKKLRGFDPRKAAEGFFDPISAVYNKEQYMRRLADILRMVCMEHDLCRRQQERWDIDYKKH